jgi:formylglycine-generating enzyme required for sulfatase activity
VLPLLAVIVLGIFALGVAAFDLLGRPTSSTPSESTRHQRIGLDAGVFTIGLTDDNKESVLQACFRLSNNPNHECRRSYLEGLGEFPSRPVQLDAFMIDRLEVSNSKYEDCVAAGDCPRRSVQGCRFFTHRGYQLDARVPQRMLDAELPAICVTRDEAEAFCSWTGGRLPTPDEWERAARGNDDRLSPWGELWAPNLMNWAETDMGGFPVVGRLDGYDLTAPVSNFEHGASPDDILNLFGNVAEWVAAAENRPDGTRGGSYRDDLREFRITRQTPQTPQSRRSDTGFRCVYHGEE